MDGTDILSFVRNPAFYAQRPVHERLYSDFSRRTTHRKLIEDISISLSNLKPYSKRSTESRIEDSLLLKDQISQARKQKERARHQSEELKSLRPAPEINKTSKLIMSKNPKNSIEALYVNSIKRGSKESKNARTASSESLIRAALIKINNDNSVICRSELVNRTEIGRKRYKSEDTEKMKYLNELRLIVSKRTNVLQPEEPPNILEMTVLDRGDYWLDKKNKRIEKAKKETEKAEIQNCTFSPNITPINGLITSVPKPRLNKSYSQIYIEKKFPASQENSTVSPKVVEKTVIKPKKNPIPYSSLSPAHQKLSYKSGQPFVNRLKKLKSQNFLNPKSQILPQSSYKS